MNVSEVVVAGGGVAGAMAACLLAQAGVQVVLLERETLPRHKICGEFISIEAQAFLARSGLDLAALGAHRVAAMRLISGDRVAEAALPFIGMGLSRLALDAALLLRAQWCGAQVLRGCCIRHIAHEARFVLDVGGIGNVVADTLFLATGKHDLRGWARRPAHAPEDLIGFKMHYRLLPSQARALSGHVELLLFPAGYAGLQMVEQERVNLCLLVQRGYVARAGGGWAGLLAALLCESAHLRERLAGSQALMDQPLSIFRVPYGFVHRASADEPERLFRLGDQVAVTPSFSGDGMAIALHSAALAVRTFLAGDGARRYHRRMGRDVRSQIGASMALYRMGQTSNGRRLMMSAAQIWPQSLTLAAALTRLRAAQ